MKGPVKLAVERTYGASKDSSKWQSDRFYGMKKLQFNREGRLTDKRIYGGDSSLIEKFTYTYNSARRVQERRFDGKLRLTHEKNYSYSWWSGDLDAAVYSPSDSLLWSATYIFDEQGREKKKKVYGPEGQLNYLITYRYNTDNYIIQQEGVDKRTYEFTDFDKYGNWIRRINTEDRIKVSITVRDITYYD